MRLLNTITKNNLVLILGWDYLIGPIFSSKYRLNYDNYIKFIEGNLPDFYDFVTLSDVVYARWPPVHFSVQVRICFFDIRSNNRWMGRGGIQLWPSRSPNINSFDHLFWGHLKKLVYSISIQNEEELTT